MTILLSVCPSDDRVWIGGIVYDGAVVRVLRELAELYLDDQDARRIPDSYRALRAAELAEVLNITEHAVCQTVYRFRRRTRRDFLNELRVVLDDSDIIENQRDWRGYRLNPESVRVCDWSAVTSLVGARDVFSGPHLNEARYDGDT